jgi:hypothetical protein
VRKIDSKSLDGFAKTKKDLYNILAIEGKLLHFIIYSSLM